MKRPTPHLTNALFQAILAGDTKAWDRFFQETGALIYWIIQQYKMPNTATNQIFTSFITSLFDKNQRKLRFLSISSQPEIHLRQLVHVYCLEFYAVDKTAELKLVVSDVMHYLLSTGAITLSDSEIIKFRLFGDYAFEEIRQRFEDKGKIFTLNMIKGRFRKILIIIEDTLTELGYTDLADLPQEEAIYAPH